MSDGLPKVAVVGTSGNTSGVGRTRLDPYEYGTSGHFIHGEKLLATVSE